MANLKQCSRCKSTVDISYFGMNRKKEPYKTCDNCRSKQKKTSKSTHTETNTITIDNEIKNYVLKLLATYSTNQLDRLMTQHKSKHVLAYAEEKLNRTNTTFRDLSVVDVFPALVELNNMADHAPSDDDMFTDFSDDSPVFKPRLSKTKQVEQHYKFKIQDILKNRTNNENNMTNDCCPTCYQGDYKQHTSCLPPDCMLCYKLVCTRCGILDNINSCEANGYYCVDCYKPSLIEVD